MLSYTQAIILGLLQGVTELFPISSLGHSVILPQVFGWNIDQKNAFFLVFLVATHFATAIVLFLFFSKDWYKIILGVLTSLKQRTLTPENMYGRLGWLIVVASIPAGLLGLLFEKKLKILFASPILIATVLIINGAVLYGAEKLKNNSTEPTPNGDPDTRASKLTWSQAFKIGCAQCLALIPGFSRTGTTLGGGLLQKLDHEASARFSFLLATPIILAAAALKLPELFHVTEQGIIGPTIAGTIASALAAYFSIRFLTKYFKTNTLKPFAWYCVIAGALSLLILLIK